MKTHENHRKSIGKTGVDGFQMSVLDVVSRFYIVV